MRPSRKSMQSSVSQMWLSHHMCENQLRRLWKCTISGHPRLTEAKLCERDSLYLWHYEKDTLHESNTPGIWDPLMLVHPLEHACLGNPRDGGAWWAAIYGVAQSRTQLKQLSSSSRVQLAKTVATENIKKVLWILEELQNDLGAHKWVPTLVLVLKEDIQVDIF